MAHNRFLFRPDGHVVHTRSAARDAAWVFGAVAVLMSLLAWGHAVDSADGDARAFDAGVVIGRTEMADTVADAYHQGRADAAAELSGAERQCAAPPPAGRPEQAL